MRDRSSSAEILALYEAGSISGLEVASAAWELCHDNPALRAELVGQFRNYPDEFIVTMVGDGLERFAAQAEERASNSAATGDNAEPDATADRPRE
jgi:hypothetical protein